MPDISVARGLKQTGALCSYVFALILTRLETAMLARRKRPASALADPAEQGEPMQTQPQTELRSSEAGILDHIVWDDAGMDLCVLEASESVVVPAAGSQSASSRSTKAPSSVSTPARKIAGRLRGSRRQRTPKSNQEIASEDEIDDSPPDMEDAADRQPCPGCARIFGVHACFLMPDKTVRWVYSDGRGIWCYDCHRTWRICFQHDHPLSWFKGWLESTPANFDSFTLHFVAVLQLHAEGASRQSQIKLPQVQARIESNKLAFRVLNLPMAPAAIVSLQDLQQPAWADVTFHCIADRLVQLAGPDGAPSLGVWVPNVSPILQGREVRRDTMGVHSLRQSLQTTSTQDLEVLRQYGMTSVTEPVAPLLALCAAPADGGGEETFGMSSKLAIKLNLQIDGAKKVLDSFSLIAWPKCAKSGPLTHAQQRLSALRDEAGFEGQSNIKDRCDKWVNLLLLSRTFLKNFRIFSKSRKLVAIFLKWMHNVPQLCSALRTVAKVEPSPTLKLLAHKLTLFQLAGGFGQALEKALGEGLADALSALDALNQDSGVSTEFKTKPDVWLEAAVHQALLHLFGRDGEGEKEEEEEEEDDEALPAPPEERAERDLAAPVEPASADLAVPAGPDLAEQFRLAVEGMKHFPQERFDLVRRDVDSLELLLRHYGNVSAVNCDDLKRALEHLMKANRTATFMKAASKHMQMADAIAVAEARILRVAENNLAFGRIQQARKVLVDGRMPRLLVDEATGRTTISNADRIANMSATKAMRENILLMNEALGLLVEKDAEETHQKLAEWADAFCNVLASIDLAHSVGVIASFKSTPFLLLSPTEVDCSSLPQEGAAEVDCSSRPQAGEPPAKAESELQACYRELKNLLVDKAFAGSSAASRIMAHLQRGFPMLATYRRDIANVSRLALRIKPLLNTPPVELYNDWREHTPQGNCNLSAVIDAVTTFGDLDFSLAEASPAVKDLLLQECSQIILCDGAVARPQVAQLALPAPGENPGCSSWEANKPGEEEKAVPEEPVSLYMLIEKLRHALWLKRSTQILDACGILVLQRHAAALEFEGVLLLGSGEESAFQGAPAVADMIKRVIQPEALISTQCAVTKSANLGEAEPWLFPAELENDLFMKLKNALGEDWAFSFPVDFSAPTEETRAVKAYDLSAAGNMYTLLNKIAGCLGYLCENYASAASPYFCQSTFVLKPDVKFAMSAITIGVDNATGALDSLLSDSGLAPEVLSQLRFPVPAAKRWTASIEKELLPALRRDILDSYLLIIETLTETLDAKPNIDAWINDRAFAADRVKRHLLGWPGRPAYSQAVNRMYKAIGTVKAAHKAFQLQPPLETDPVLSKQLGEAQAAYLSGKEMIRIIAAAAVLLEYAPQDRPAEAKKLLADPSAHFPKALRDLLEKERDRATLDGGRPPKRSKISPSLSTGAVSSV